jgi:hypothetical protein
MNAPGARENAAEAGAGPFFASSPRVHRAFYLNLLPLRLIVVLGASAGGGVI